MKLLLGSILNETDEEVKALGALREAIVRMPGKGYGKEKENRKWVLSCLWKAARSLSQEGNIIPCEIFCERLPVNIKTALMNQARKLAKMGAVELIKDGRRIDRIVLLHEGLTHFESPTRLPQRSVHQKNRPDNTSSILRNRVEDSTEKMVSMSPDELKRRLERAGKEGSRKTLESLGLESEDHLANRSIDPYRVVLIDMPNILYPRKELGRMSPDRINWDKLKALLMRCGKKINKAIVVNNVASVTGQKDLWQERAEKCGFEVVLLHHSYGKDMVDPHIMGLITSLSTIDFRKHSRVTLTLASGDGDYVPVLRTALENAKVFSAELEIEVYAWQDGFSSTLREVTSRKNCIFLTTEIWN